MPLPGTAALAMWGDMVAPMRSETEHWHTHEHFTERQGVPGFRRASRWTRADGGPGVSVVYEPADHAVLQSPAHLARLNAPTPWSTRMMCRRIATGCAAHAACWNASAWHPPGWR